MFCYTCYICYTSFHSSQKLCFSPLKALLPDSKSIAFRLSEQCSWPPKAMLLASESNALGVTEQCSGGYRAMFCMVRSNALYGTELCSVRYGAVLEMGTCVVVVDETICTNRKPPAQHDGWTGGMLCSNLFISSSKEVMAAPWLFHNHLASLAIAQVGSLKEEQKV